MFRRALATINWSSRPDKRVFYYLWLLFIHRRAPEQRPTRRGIADTDLAARLRGGRAHLEFHRRGGGTQLDLGCDQLPNSGARGVSRICALRAATSWREAHGDGRRLFTAGPQSI